MTSTKTLIVVLGGALVKDKHGVWHTANYDEGDNFGVSGDRAIIVAAASLKNDYRGCIFVVSGGKGQNKNIIGIPNISSVIKNELIKLGVSALDIIEENHSQNTYQQLKNVQMIYEEKNIQNIIIICNQHTLPRIQAMIEFKVELTKLKIAFDSSYLKLLSAEGILLKRNPATWKEIIENAYASEPMKKRIALEERGARQVKEGTYKYK